jgi:hypothetical protein
MKAPRQPASKTKAEPMISRRGRKSRPWQIVGIVLLVLMAVGGIGRLILPQVVHDYVNRTLDRSPLYEGEIGRVRLHLWRGAYSVEDVRINKSAGNIPVPLFSAQRVDFALQWNALFRGRLVGRVLLEQPELNFVDGPAEGEDLTGAGGPWLQMIRDLFPFKINRAVVQNGSVHFRAFKTETPLDVYLSQVQGSVENLANVQDETTPLLSTVHATGLVMEQARFEYRMTLDPFAYRPTFKLALRMLGLDVTKINDLALAYGKFDFKRGWFDFVVEAEAKEGQLVGYAKPLFRNLSVFSLAEDLQQSNPLQCFWQALVGVTVTLFKNQARDQFGTLIPFKGDASASTTMDVLATIGNMLRNAFVRAYLPRLEGGWSLADGLEFAPAEFNEALATGGSL